eukprot:1124446-Pleurochrysis_carterae.AAC.3
MAHPAKTRRYQSYRGGTLGQLFRLLQVDAPKRRSAACARCTPATLAFASDGVAAAWACATAAGESPTADEGSADLRIAGAARTGARSRSGSRVTVAQRMPMAFGACLHPPEAAASWIGETKPSCAWTGIAKFATDAAARKAGFASPAGAGPAQSSSSSAPASMGVHVEAPAPACNAARVECTAGREALESTGLWTCGTLQNKQQSKAKI